MRILYLDLDTLRPDHLGCYGYHRNTSPNIDRIAKEGIRFNNYYCSDAPCLPSRTAMMSSRFGIHSGVVNHGGLCADLRPEGKDRDFVSQYGETTLPSMLFHHGLHTVYIGGFGARHSAWHLYAGFQEIHDTGMRGMESADDVSPTVLDWIARRGKDDNWYLHINYWDPHTPFRAPPEFGNPFENDPLPDWLTSDLIKKHREMPGPHTIQDLSMYSNDSDPAYPRQPGEVQDIEDMCHLIDGYDCGIRYADEHVGKILLALDVQGVLNDTIIIISADHGENYGELGIYAEHGTADHATCRIPMIIRWPGLSGNRVNNGLHYNLDLLPTLAEMLDIRGSDLWDGQSYSFALTSDVSVGRDYLIISQCAHVCQRSVRWNDYLWIRSWHDGFHLFDEEMLFNLKEDPHETKNLADELPELCDQARAKYAGWHSQMMETMPEGWGDPLDTVLKEGGPHHARGMIKTKKYVERLEQTGRGFSLNELKMRHPNEFK